LVLLHHGVFSYGASAREAYENMLKLVELAEQFLASRRAWQLPVRGAAHDWTDSDIAELRCAVSRAAGFPLVLQSQDTDEFWAFAQNPEAARWWEQGPATPQHAVFVKRTPLFGRDVARYAHQYHGEVSQHRPGTTVQALGLDPAPRVIVDPQLGVWTAGVNAHYADMTAEIFRHDVEIISRASGHDRYAGLPRSAILDAEIHYGGFEGKLRAQYDQSTCLLGEVRIARVRAGWLRRSLARWPTEVRKSLASPKVLQPIGLSICARRITPHRRFCVS
jgi:rhamnose utilization protein RhaD (predicted bifunctional aldolase and dehydrogenase)